MRVAQDLQIHHFHIWARLLLAQLLVAEVVAEHTLEPPLYQAEVVVGAAPMRKEPIPPARSAAVSRSSWEEEVPGVLVPASKTADQVPRAASTSRGSKAKLAAMTRCETGMGPRRKAGAAWLRGGVAQNCSSDLCVTASMTRDPAEAFAAADADLEVVRRDRTGINERIASERASATTRSTS